MLYPVIIINGKRKVYAMTTIKTVLTHVTLNKDQNSTDAAGNVRTYTAVGMAIKDAKATFESLVAEGHFSQSDLDRLEASGAFLGESDPYLSYFPRSTKLSNDNKGDSFELSGYTFSLNNYVKDGEAMVGINLVPIAGVAQAGRRVAIAAKVDDSGWVL